MGHSRPTSLCSVTARNKLKILLWDHNGFWFLYRRLEKGLFQWPSGNEGTVIISGHELRWLLDGLALEQHKAHSPIRAETII